MRHTMSSMNRQLAWTICLAVLTSCSDSSDNTAPPPPPVATQIAPSGGDGQIAPAGSLLPQQLSALVTAEGGTPVPEVTVSWSVIEGGGTISPASSTTNSSGVASAGFTLGPTEGVQRAQAEVSGLAGSPVVFTATATVEPEPVPTVLRVLSGGNNVPDRFSSDLWVHGSYAYTGTWGFREEEGNVLNVWSLDAAGAPTLVNTVIVEDIGTVSDVEVSSDGQVLMFGAEFGSNGGIHLYSLANPAAPAFLDRALVNTGIHTATFGEIGGRRYAFAARNPSSPALLIYDVTDPANISLTARVAVPNRYGIHDTYVRDGLAFVFVWDAGVIIYDVGNGIRGGSPAAPVEVSRLVTASRGASSPSAHNGWWFHNPVSDERRYLFVGQEGPAVIGSEATGDIHVVDVSDLTQPQEVAYFHLSGAGTHNFWMDEQKQILYAAYYNGGVVALDVSGTLTGNLSDRLLSRIRPGGAGNTFTWGVQLANGFLYAIDMLSGFWQLTTE